MFITKSEQKDLRSIDWEKYWPILSPLPLAFLELERDEHFSYLLPEQLSDYLTTAMNIGTKTAQPYMGKDIISFINEIIRIGLRIHFVDQHPTNSSIRAQYHRKNKTITIYKNSLTQLQKFLSPAFGEISKADLIRLHLYHEWFHYLEETKIGRTDLKLPKVIIKKRGPFLVKRSLYRLREVAAHAFTQTALGLTWSPLILDQYRLHLEQGHTRAQIRESFHTTETAYYAIINKNK